MATAKAADETCQAEVVGAEQNLASESKKEADISLACETIDQALENVLKETKGEYKLFNKVNVNCAALSKVPVLFFERYCYCMSLCSLLLLGPGSRRAA